MNIKLSDGSNWCESITPLLTGMVIFPLQIISTFPMQSRHKSNAKKILKTEKREIWMSLFRSTHRPWIRPPSWSWSYELTEGLHQVSITSCSIISFVAIRRLAGWTEHTPDVTLTQFCPSVCKLCMLPWFMLLASESQCPFCKMHDYYLALVTHGSSVHASPPWCRKCNAAKRR